MSSLYTFILSFLLGIVASFIASLLFSFQQKSRIIKRNTRTFKKLEGKYQHYSIEDVIVEGNTSEFIFITPNKLKIITNSTRGHNWEGEIIMSELEPNAGEGYFEYRYPDKYIWGILNIQVSRNGDKLLVQAIDKSQKEESQLGYIMRKINSKNNSQIV